MAELGPFAFSSRDLGDIHRTVEKWENLVVMRIKSGEEVLHDLPKIIIALMVGAFIANVIAGFFGLSLPFPGK